MTPDDHYEKFLAQVVSKLGNGETYSNELADVGKEMFGKKFNGVFSADEIPQKFTSIIANLDDRSEGGSHWIAIARTPEGKYLVYDSFGRKTDKIIGQGVSHLDTYDTEYDAEQDVKEENCGARCLAWLKVFHRFGKEAAYQI